MSKKAKTPKAPDYAALAREQAALQQQSIDKQTSANRANQENPFGSLTWEQDPTTGKWSQSVTLAPEYEELRQQQAANQGGLAGLVGDAVGGYDASQVDLGSLGPMPEAGGYDEQALATIRALQAPDLERRRNAAQTRMAAMGLSDPGAAASQAMQQSIGDAESRADMNAILESLRRGDTRFGQEMDRYKTGVSTQLQEKAANLTQLGGLFGLTQNVQSPTFAGYTPASAAGAPDLMGAGQLQYGAALDKANAQNASGSWMAPVLGAAGTAIGSPIGGAIGSGIGSGISGAFKK